MAMGGIVRVRIIDPVESQVDYLEANDYSPPDRMDSKATDPARLLGDRPTYMVLDLVPLAADSELVWEAEIDALVPIEGPRQIDLGGE